MAFQMPEIQNNIGNALANIGQMRQQRTQNALAERQLALTEGAQRRQDEQFRAEQQTAAQERQRTALADVFNAVQQGKTPERAREIGASIMQSPQWQARFGQGGDTLAQQMLSQPDAWRPENIRAAAAQFGIRLRTEELADMAAEARVKRAPARPERRVLTDENRNYVQVDLGTGEQTPLGMRAPAPPPPQPSAVIYQQGPQAPSFVDAQGNPVPTVFNPRTGQYEAAAVTPGLTPAPRPPPNMTDGQSKALLFGSRMRESNSILDQLATEGVTSLPLGYRAASETPVLGAAVVANSSEATQSLDQAQRDFINAVLRRESGASISPQEFDNADRQYFPQPNEGPRVIEQKRRARELALQGILAEVPEARRDSVRPPARPSQVPRIKTTAEWQALPRGTRYVDPNGVERVKN